MESTCTDISWHFVVFSNNGNSGQLTSIGGTFDALHSGHKEYIRLAFDISWYVLIYITTEALAQKMKNYEVLPYEFRAKRVQNFVHELGCQNRVTIRALNCCSMLQSDFLENREISQKISCAVVSPDYYDFFHDINERRLKKGLATIHLLVKWRIHNGDNIELSSSGIRNGQIKDTENCYTGVLDSRNGKANYPTKLSRNMPGI